MTTHGSVVCPLYPGHMQRTPGVNQHLGVGEGPARARTSKSSADDNNGQYDALNYRLLHKQGFAQTSGVARNPTKSMTPEHGCLRRKGA